jgi:hypothetical protein
VPAAGAMASNTKTPGRFTPGCVASAATPAGVVKRTRNVPSVTAAKSARRVTCAWSGTGLPGAGVGSSMNSS